MCSTGKDFIVL